MYTLFLNRMNSWQEIVKKKQETIFEISIGSLYNFKFILKTRFRYAHVFSLVFAFSFAPTRTIPKPRRQHPIYKKIIHFAIFKDLGEKLPDPSV